MDLTARVEALANKAIATNAVRRVRDAERIKVQHEQQAKERALIWKTIRDGDPALARMLTAVNGAFGKPEALSVTVHDVKLIDGPEPLPPKSYWNGKFRPAANQQWWKK